MRAIFFVFKCTVSPAKDNEIRFSKPYSKYSLFFQAYFVATSPLAKPFKRKWVWFAWKWMCRWNSFSYEWFRTKTHFDTEVKGNSKMAYWKFNKRLKGNSEEFDNCMVHEFARLGTKKKRHLNYSLVSIDSSFETLKTACRPFCWPLPFSSLLRAGFCIFVLTLRINPLTSKSD